MLQQLMQATAPLSVADVIAREIEPKVETVDADGRYPIEALRALGHAEAFSHHVGGGQEPDGLRRAIADMAAVGEVCLSTAFCIWCQDALAWYLDRSENPEARERNLSAVASGAQLGGTGLSNPMKALSGIEPLALTGERVADGYRVSGRLPWVSNLGTDHRFASVFALDGGRRIMAVFDCATPGLQLMQNAHFIALEGTGTYTVGLRQVFVPDRDVITEDAVGFLPRIRQTFVLLQLGMAIGLARGIAQAMLADRRGRTTATFLPHQPEAILDRAHSLAERAAELAVNQADPSRGAFLDVLRTRLAGSWLALEAAQAGSLQFGARGYIAGSQIFRRQREAQFVAIVTPSIKHITMELARDAVT